MNTIATLLAFLVLVSAAAVLAGSAHHQGSECVEYENPPGSPAIAAGGTYSQEAFVKSPECVPVFVAGNRGIYPTNNTQVPLDQPNGVYLRIKQAFANMLEEAAYYGATYLDCVEVVVFVIDMVSIRPVVNQVQSEIWGVATATNPAPYPPRTILQISGLDGLTCEYGSGNYTQGVADSNGQAFCTGSGVPIGDILEVKGTFFVKKNQQNTNKRRSYVRLL